MDYLSDMVEVKLLKDFSLVRETLRRIGVPTKDGRFYPSCYILSKNNRQNYYLVHFKEMFILDGKSSSFCYEDKIRRNFIANLCENWGLIEVLDKTKIEERSEVNSVKILKYEELKNWDIVHKYTLGK